MKNQIHINLCYKTKWDLITSFIGKIVIFSGGMLFLLTVIGAIFKRNTLGYFAELVIHNFQENLIAMMIITFILGLCFSFIATTHKLKVDYLIMKSLEGYLRQPEFKVFDLKKDLELDNNIKINEK